MRITVIKNNGPTNVHIEEENEGLYFFEVNGMKPEIVEGFDEKGGRWHGYIGNGSMVLTREKR